MYEMPIKRAKILAIIELLKNTEFILMRIRNKIGKTIGNKDVTSSE
jgi:hypothetical protein